MIKPTIKLAVFMIAPILFAAAANASCLAKYEETYQNTPYADTSAYAAAAAGGVVAGAAAGMSQLMAPNPGSKADVVSVAAVGSVGGGGATLLALSNDREDLERMIAILRDVELGEGLAFNWLHGEVYKTAQYSRSKVFEVVKEANNSGLLCQGGQLGTSGQLIEHILQVLKQ